MKEKDVFFNPFRLISPKLNIEASRIKDLAQAPPEDVTTLEEGLLVMARKLGSVADIIYNSLTTGSLDKIEQAKVLGQEVHSEEKALTDGLLKDRTSELKALKLVLMFPGHLERAGDFLESVINVCRIKAEKGVPFSDRAISELKGLFSTFGELLHNFENVIFTRNRTLLKHMSEQHNHLAQMTVDFALAHEERLIDGLCSPRASSLYLDILDSIKNANHHLRNITQALANSDKAA
jgi:Na+/phosphate symporter